MIDKQGSERIVPSVFLFVVLAAANAWRVSRPAGQVLVERRGA